MAEPSEPVILQAVQNDAAADPDHGSRADDAERREEIWHARDEQAADKAYKTAGDALPIGAGERQELVGDVGDDGAVLLGLGALGQPPSPRPRNAMDRRKRGAAGSVTAQIAPGTTGSQKAKTRCAATPTMASSSGTPAAACSSSAVAASTPPVAMSGIGSDWAR